MEESSSRIFAPGLLAGQVCMVSGGGTGLGRASALELARLGAGVIICGRREEPLEAVVGEIEGAGGRAELVPLDIRDDEAVDALFDGVLERHGRLDLLVNNAGGQFLSPAEAISPKGFRTVIELNVTGTWLMTHAAATKAFIPQEQGKVITVTISPHNGMPGMVHSGAARAAAENMMRTLSVEWADGAAGPLGTEEELAWLVAYLASPAGDFFSGSVLTLDGARDNWFGAWPPGVYGETGEPPAEERRRRG
jgi:citronellol/citronellal dehydrogenase